MPISIENENVKGTITIGKRVCQFLVQADGALVFPTTSRAEGLAIVEAIDRQINAGQVLPALPSPTHEAVPRPRHEPVDAEPRPEPAPKLAKDGSRRGRPPKR